jgi:carbohydrate diacid regulator
MGDIVAAVEIIGKKEDTVKIDEITRSMAESLVYQTLLKSQRLLKSELKRQVFRQMFQYPDSDLNTVLGRGLVVGLDFEEFDRVIVGMVKGFTYKEVFSDQEEFDEIYNSYKYSFKHHASIETSLVDDQFIGVVNDIPADELEEIIEKVCKDVGDDRLVIGVGKEVSSYKRLRISYDQAIRAINTNVYSSNKNVFMYEKLDVELLLGDINEDSKQEFLRKVFKNMNEEDILRIKETLEIYFRNNGSITETAEEMFVHKNTLQYRLNKIAEDTGYNPRVLNEGFILMTAIKMYTL